MFIRSFFNNQTKKVKLWLQYLWEYINNDNNNLENLK